MIVVLTREAESDLDAIADYVARDSMPAALKLVDDIKEKCLALAHAPRAWPLVPRYEHHGIRRRPFGNYLVFYRIGREAVEVVHILHGARDYEALLFPER